MPVQYYSEAIREALREEMARDERVFLMGEDIARYGGAFGVSRGLLEQFGPERVRNTPISEATIVGAAVGAALLGSRPVVEIMFMDFLILGLDQLLNHAAKFRYSYGDQFTVPLVVRTPAGGGRGYGPSHSQCLERLVYGIPGVKIAFPSTPADAKGLLKTAIRDDNPVLFVEDKLLYPTKGTVPEGDHLVPFGEARLVREGRDLTLVAWGRMVNECEKAATLLASEGIQPEIIDLRTLKPMDVSSIVGSIQKTGRLVLVEEGHRTGGISADIAARVFEEAYYRLDAPIRRVCAEDIPIPASVTLERQMLPHAGDIVQAARSVMAE